MFRAALFALYLSYVFMSGTPTKQGSGWDPSGNTLMPPNDTGGGVDPDGFVSGSQWDPLGLTLQALRTRWEAALIQTEVSERFKKASLRGLHAPKEGSLCQGLLPPV